MNWTITNMSSGVYDLAITLNTFTDNFFWTIVVVIIWFVTFGLLFKSGGDKAITYAFFISLIVSSLLVWISLINQLVFGICLAGLLVSLFAGGRSIQ